MENSFDEGIIDDITNKLLLVMSERRLSHVTLTQAPVLIILKWSFILRYEILSTKGLEGILVKIPRHPDIDTIYEACKSNRFRKDAIAEYDALSEIFFGFQHHTKSDFTAACPYALWEEHSAFALEEIKCSSKLKVLFNFCIVFPVHQLRTSESLGKAGELLGFYHANIGKITKSKLALKNTLNNIDALASEVNSLSPSLKVPIRVRDIVFNLIEKRGDLISLPVSFLHGDFTSSNVLVAPDNRLFLIDPNRSFGPVYQDIAHFVTEILTLKKRILCQRIFPSSFVMMKFLTSFVRGYTKYIPVDYDVLIIFCVLEILEKWKEDLLVLQGMTKNKLILRIGLFWISLVFSRIIMDDLKLLNPS